MRALLRKSKHDPRIRDCAADLILGLPGKSWRNEIATIFLWVRDFIRFQRDPVDLELVQQPWETLTRGYGDCDDHALLTAALLESVGHPTLFMAVGFQPYSLTHVYCMAKDGNGWIACDTTEPQPLGWEPPGIRNRLRIFNGG